MSFFTDFSEAKRYAQNRPYFHPLAIDHAVKTLDIKEKYPLALDIACGTGHSSLPLLSISDQVVGLDISWNMLVNAESSAQIRYVQSRAEEMPFRSNSFPISFCALAFHWFDRGQFFGEVRRVLKSDGYLVIYNNGFTGAMKEDPEFLHWAQNVYPERFPTPPRNSQPLTSEETAEMGFELTKEDAYKNEIIFTPNELAGYLITQTNVVSALQLGQETVDSARHWLHEQVHPYFAQESATFVFSTRIWYFRKVG